MRLLFSNRAPLFVIAIIGAFVVLLLAGRALFFNNEPEKEQAVVTRDDVEVFVTVSGTVRTPNTATLSFPKAGVVSEVLIREGDTVSKGQILASLTQSALTAEYSDALAYLKIQEAYRDELVTGPRDESRAVIETTAEIAEKELGRTLNEQDELVLSALRKLYSSDLQAVPEKPTNDDTPPIITGTYRCEMPETYRFEIYPSQTKSGHSFRMLEGGGGVDSAVTESATPFGDCGLYIQFEEGQIYSRSTWLVEVPNPRSASYVTNLNAYNVALSDRENAIEAAQQNLAKAREEKVLDLAEPRTEELARAEAQVTQARARLLGLEAQIADTTIRAPFDGVVTSVNITIGEVGNTERGITMTAADEYDLRARIPEIDIAHIEAGDRAVATFDAKPDEPVGTTVSFVSPIPTEIDGVSYFDAYLDFDTTPLWIRSGLNADIDIVTDSALDTLVLPRRFVEDENGDYFVTKNERGTPTRIPVSIGLIGNDGFVEIRDLEEGTTVTAP